MNIIFRNIDGFEYIHPNVDGAEVSEDIILTKIAVEKITEQLNKIITDVDNSNNYFVRLYLISTPSKAKQYSIKFDNEINDFDRIFELGILKIIIDRKDLFYFMGILIDYVEDENEDGFVFFDISDPKVIDYYSNYLKGNS